jgi:hypothetical protein
MVSRKQTGKQVGSGVGFANAGEPETTVSFAEGSVRKTGGVVKRRQTGKSQPRLIGYDGDEIQSDGSDEGEGGGAVRFSPATNSPTGGYVQRKQTGKLIGRPGWKPSPTGPRDSMAEVASFEQELRTAMQTKLFIRRRSNPRAKQPQSENEERMLESYMSSKYPPNNNCVLSCLGTLPSSMSTVALCNTVLFL